MTRMFVVGEPAGGHGELIAEQERLVRAALEDARSTIRPGVGLAGRQPLVVGDVLAIEPGLWDSRIGGFRFEDLVLVSEDGAETLTDYSYSLNPSG